MGGSVVTGARVAVVDVAKADVGAPGSDVALDAFSPLQADTHADIMTSSPKNSPHLNLYEKVSILY